MRALLPRRRRQVLALVDLVQDIDVLLPALLVIRNSPDLGLKILVSAWLERESPRTAAILRAHRLPFAFVRRREIIEGRQPSLRGVAAVLAASESSHPAHAGGHALARRASGLGIRTYALQHGFEQIGLFGPEAAQAEFASQTVFCWFPEAAAPADLPAETRQKLAPVGRPAPPGGWSRDPVATFDLGVFENLHWDRYGDQEREGFLRGLTAVAQVLPHLRILLRPHPAGGWADQIGHELAPFENIVRPSAQETRANLDGGAQILRGLSRVITTPSTVALDAALAAAPVALAAPGGASYQPVPVLADPQAWVAFASGESYDEAVLDQFRSRVLVEGDGAPRIVERLRRDLVQTMAVLP
ncbi:MAG TPA: hypothetical protein VHX64_04555 [Caulobacteraceae bacterium]|nr:hypothetical protein [Caulobacteraceae bacterium]